MKQQLKIVFRVDASLKIGSGHVMRCITLADALRERGATCNFISLNHEGNLIELIRGLRYEVDVLQLENKSREGSSNDVEDGNYAQWLGNQWELDAKQTKSVINDREVDWLIIDHYALDARWEAELRPYCKKILVIDDLANRFHDSDLLLDQNLVNNISNRYRDKVPQQCGVMLGPDYALLQPQYKKLHKITEKNSESNQKILVYFGGADSSNLTGMTVDAFILMDMENVEIDVVVTSVSPFLELIQSKIKGHSQIRLYKDVPSLAPLMIEADFAIGAGGSTTWERCCLGLPSIVITLADNQREIAQELDRRGLIKWLGHKNKVDIDVLMKSIRGLISGNLGDSREKCRNLVDGYGAERVASVVYLSSGAGLSARQAVSSDESRLHYWVNDLLVRRYSFNSDYIDEKTHSTWFRDKLSDKEYCRIYIIESDYSLAIGQVRFDREKNSNIWVVDYSIDSFARGKGLGKKILAVSIATLLKEVGGGTVVGNVKKENIASCRVFSALGFSVKSESDMMIYRKEFSSIVDI